MIPHTRFRKIAILALGCGLAWVGTARAAEDQPDAQVVELRATIGKIVDVKAQAAAERGAWEEEKARMNELLGLHRQELTLLDEEQAKAGTSVPGEDEQRAGLEEKIKALKSVRGKVSETVARGRERLLALSARFPLPLLEEAAPERAKLEAWRPGDEPREGLQALLEIISKAEQFNRRITRTAEQREGHEAEVLYLGLARAYYTDRGGHAGVGFPGRDGWVWESRPKLAGEILRALEELDRKRPPALVRLPVKIERGTP